MVGWSLASFGTENANVVPGKKKRQISQVIDLQSEDLEADRLPEERMREVMGGGRSPRRQKPSGNRTAFEFGNYLLHCWLLIFVFNATPSCREFRSSIRPRS